MEDCCNPAYLFAMTKVNSPMGKSLWYDGEFLYSLTIDNSTYSLFPQVSGVCCTVIEFVLLLTIRQGYRALLTHWDLISHLLFAHVNLTYFSSCPSMFHPPFDARKEVKY